MSLFTFLILLMLASYCRMDWVMVLNTVNRQEESRDVYRDEK